MNEFSRYLEREGTEDQETNKAAYLIIIIISFA